jgi:hypothetical protein
MTIEFIIQNVLIIGLITGAFTTFAPVLFGHAINVIFKIFSKSS